MVAFISTLPVSTASAFSQMRVCSTGTRRRLQYLAPKNARPITRARRVRCSADASESAQIPLPQGESLVQAAMLGNTGVVVNLLSDGVPPSYASLQGGSQMTALMWAAAEGYVQIFEQLLAAGADVNSRNAEGTTALLFAVENLPSTNPRDAPPPGFPGRPGPQPAQVPIVPRLTGHVSIIRQLLERGADIRVRNGFDETLLHLTTRKAQDGLIRELLGRGLDITACSVGFQETALHVAAKEGHADVVGLLCELGANVEARNRFGWTPLLWASACGWESVARELIARGADANIQAGEGAQSTSALKEARRCSCAQTMSRLLIRAGAIE